MKSSVDALDLARRLVCIDTISPGEGEQTALEEVAKVLSDAGFQVSLPGYDPARPGRRNLCARLHPESDKPSLCFAGHIDTVPLGREPWQHDPLGGKVIDGELYGRGSCDMKSGVACMAAAAAAMAPRIDGDLVVHIYGGEELGCEGSFHLVAGTDSLDHVGAVIVGEPTNARPLVGHKGALWLKLTARGVTAHASMPEQGLNALALLVPSATRLLLYHAPGKHPVLGTTTSVLSTLHGGLNINSVPDLATLTLDFRTVPGVDHDSIRRDVKELVEHGLEIVTLLDIPPVWTDPDLPWPTRVIKMWAEAAATTPEAGTVAFYTDAAAMRSKLPDTPVLIFGPGASDQAHKVDETCPVDQISFMTAMYERIIADWYNVR